MIKSLFLKNFALFKETQILFENGLNIITGETGAGKSLLLKSLKFLSGERFSKDFIRNKKDRCVLEVEYFIDEPIIIRRVFHRDGKSRTFINDEPVSIEKLREVSNSLLDYHGQHENQKLFNPNEQLKILDQFAGNKKNVSEIQSIYQLLKNNSKLILDLEKKKRKFHREQEIIEFQLNEISEIQFNPEDDINITKKIKKLSHQTDIKQKLEHSIKLYKYDILEKMNQIRRNIEFISSIDEDFKPVLERVDNVVFELDDISNDIEKQTINHIPNQNEIQELNDSLTHLEMLKRKYGGSLEAVIEYQNEIIKTIQNNSTVNEDLKIANKNDAELTKKYKILNKKISIKRKSSIPKLIKLIEKNISKLGMENTSFHIDLLELNEKEFYLNGNNKCEFKISSNKSDDAKLLNKIASGGEISRIQLAIKMLNIDVNSREAIVFDEIDTGISGRIAEMTGQVMKEISKSQQVLCITHLPQIAGQSDFHFVPQKIINKHDVDIKIKKLNSTEKIEEIASLMSGNKITQTSKARAKEILKVSKNG